MDWYTFDKMPPESVKRIWVQNEKEVMFVEIGNMERFSPSLWPSKAKKWLGWAICKDGDTFELKDIICS